MPVSLIGFVCFSNINFVEFIFRANEYTNWVAKLNILFTRQVRIQEAWLPTVSGPLIPLHSLGCWSVQKSRLEKITDSTASRTALGPTQPPIQWVPGALTLGVKRPGVKLTIHLHLVPRSRMRGAIPPLPQYVFMAWCLVKHRDNFTFPLPEDKLQ
jgi:hypothetical protein